MAVATRPKSVEEIKAELDAIKAKKEVAPKTREKPGYYGLIFCDDYGWCWLADDTLQTKCLGRTEEIIPYLKKRGITGEKVTEVFQAVREYPREKKACPQNQILMSGKSMTSAVGDEGHPDNPDRPKTRTKNEKPKQKPPQTHTDAQKRRVTKEKNKSKKVKTRKVTPAPKPSDKRKGKSQR